MRRYDIPLHEIITNNSINGFLLDRRTTTMPGAFFVQLEPTNRCNLNCLFCTRKTSKDAVRDISLEKLRTILDSNSNTRIIKLQGLGEPLMHPDLEKIVKEIKDRGIVLATITNGTLIKENRSLIEKYFDMVEVSLDTLDPEQFKTIRRGSTLPQVLEGIQVLKDIRNTKKNFKVGVNSVISHINIDQDRKLRAFCRENNLMWSRDRIANWTPANDKRWNANHEFVQKDREINGPIIKIRPFCAWSYYKAYITAEGNYTPCCWRMEKTFEIDDNWNDIKMQKFREARSKQPKLPMCEHCPN